MTRIIESLLAWAGRFYGETRDGIFCSACGLEHSHTTNEKFCRACRGEIVAVVPQPELNILRFRVWKSDWFPWRACDLTFEGDQPRFGPMEWFPPERGPFRWLWRKSP